MVALERPHLGGIMSLLDEKQVVGELCQLTILNYWARHGGCLTQVSVRDGIIQRTRLTESHLLGFP
jgi:hypothetical protein